MPRSDCVGPASTGKWDRRRARRRQRPSGQGPAPPQAPQGTPRREAWEKKKAGRQAPSSGQGGGYSMRRPTVCTLALALLGLLALSPAAPAKVPVRMFGFLPSTTQAGGHPDLQVAFSLQNARKQQEEEGANTPCDCENARFVTVHAPQGLIGNPHATPQCTVSDFSADVCPVDSQVGVVIIQVGGNPFLRPVFNVVPRAGEAALLAFEVIG